MREKLISELKNIAQKILNIQGREDIAVLKARVAAIYEKLIVLEFMETLAGKGEAMKKFERLAASVIAENKIPESSPHEEDIVMPVMHKIKALVAEMPVEETLDDILTGVQTAPAFVKKEEKESVSGGTISEPKKRSLNDVLKKEIHIGLNDRIGFVKHLFNESDEDFDKVIAQLNTMETWTAAGNFIANRVKPNYNNWAGKEDYETRFLALVEVRFNS